MCAKRSGCAEHAGHSGGSAAEGKEGFVGLGDGEPHEHVSYGLALRGLKLEVGLLDTRSVH